MLMKRTKSIVFITFVLFIFPASMIVALALYVYKSEQESVRFKTSAHEKALTKIGKAEIERSLESVTNDIVFLANYHQFRNYINLHTNDLKQDFINDFMLVMNNRRTYDHIRWIDETGMERFRLAYLNDKTYVYPDNMLQSKKERYYFKQGLLLPLGAVYISPFDLNVEYEKVEIPHKPMIRIATALVDDHGHRRGIFIINYLGADVLKRFGLNTAASYAKMMILNQDGYYIKGERSEDEWGFMRHRTDLTLGHRYPAVWKRMANMENGQFEDENGLWTFSTVHPQTKNSTGHVYNNSSFSICETNKECAWKVVSFVPAQVLYEDVNKHEKWIVGAVLMSLIAAGIASFGLAYLYRKKEEMLNTFKQLQQQTQGILLAVPDIIMQVDNDKRYVWANTQGLMFFGEGVIGKEASEYFVGAQDTYDKTHPLMAGEVDMVYLESWQRRYDGEKRLLGWWCRNLKDDEGNITGALSAARDITEEYERKQSIEKLSKAVEQVDDIVYTTDKAGIIAYVNDAFCRHTGYTREEAIGDDSKIIKSGMHGIGFYKELWTTILSGGVYRNTLINRKKNGDLYYEKKTITPLKEDGGNLIGFISTGKDVTQETMLHQEVERIATLDQLTGIYNRHKFEELFTLESERSRRFSHALSLIMIDIDYFKAVNDTYGHDIGDKVLIKLAEIVQSNIRKIDIFARWGGEEFLILCPGTDMEHARGVAEKLRLAVEGSVFEDVGKLTISLGVTLLKSEESFNELFKRVDERLYYAKEHGRNQVGTSI